MSRRGLLLAGAVAAVLLVAGLWQRQRRGAGQTPWEHSPRPAQAPGAFSGAELPTAARPVTVVGRVQDPEGRAVAAAFLALVAEDEGAQGPRQRRPVTTAAADAQGAFVLPDVPPGTYTLAATAPGFLPGSVPVERARPGGPGLILVTLRPGGFLISGRVLDTVGGAIGEAQVALVSGGWKNDSRGLATTVAGPDGAYRLTVPAGQHGVVFRRDGYSERVLDVRATRDQIIDVRLSAGVRLSGRVVVRDTQQPVAGAQVTVRSVRSLEDLAHASTDEQGAFAIAGLTAGAYEVVARRGLLAGSHERPLVLTPAGEQRVLIAIDRGATVEGRVRHPDGRAVAGARLKLGRWDFDTSRGDPAGNADARGRFTIQGVLPEHTSVIAFAGQHAWGNRRIHILPGDHIRDLDVVVPESRELVVSVSSDGRPLGGAEVSVWSARGAGWNAESVTGLDGQAWFPDIPTGKIAIAANHREARAETLLEVGESPRTVARLILQPVERVTVQGRVSWRDGRPAGDVTVFIYCHGLLWAHQRSDPDGSYRFEGCEPGPLDVRAFRSDASLDDWQRTHDPNQHRPLAAGERVRTVDLTVAGGGKRIAGRALTADGRPAAGALVTVVGGLEKRSDSTDPDGRFELTDLARQGHTVRVELVGHPQVETDTSEADAPALLLRMRPGARLSGMVRGPEGKPRPYTRVSASSGRDGDETYSGASGTFVLAGLAAGKFQVHVRGDEGFDQLVAEVVLEPGADRKLDLIVPAPTN